jgi:hypothetical protein
VGRRALTGYPGLWRIRVGDYRVVYTIKDAELIVLALRIAPTAAAGTGSCDRGPEWRLPLVRSFSGGGPLCCPSLTQREHQ